MKQMNIKLILHSNLLAVPGDERNQLCWSFGTKYWGAEKTFNFVEKRWIDHSEVENKASLIKNNNDFIAYSLEFNSI